MDIVRLVDRVGADGTISNAIFEDTILVGPAVMALLDNVTLESSSFEGDPESLFIEVPLNRRVIGVVGLRNSTFRRCQFKNVGIIGVADAIAIMRAELIQGTLAHQATPPPPGTPQPVATTPVGAEQAEQPAAEPGQQSS